MNLTQSGLYSEYQTSLYLKTQNTNKQSPQNKENIKQQQLLLQLLVLVLGVVAHALISAMGGRGRWL